MYSKLPSKLSARLMAGMLVIALASTAQAIDPNGLVAYWDFENGLTDGAGGDNNGTFAGNAFIDSGANAREQVLHLVEVDPAHFELGVLGLHPAVRRARGGLADCRAPPSGRARQSDVRAGGTAPREAGRCSRS